MKKLISTAALTLFFVVVSFAGSVKQPSPKLNNSNEMLIENHFASDLNQKEAEVFMNIELDDDALKCKITITVTVGPVQVSGSVEGPCDEVKAKAVELMGELVDKAN